VVRKLQRKPSRYSLFNMYLQLRTDRGDLKSREFFRHMYETSSADSGEVVLPRYEFNEQSEIPDRTIVIPVEVMQESADNVLNVLQLLERECSRSFKGRGRNRELKRTEVILWFNSESMDRIVQSKDGKAYAEAAAEYAEISEMLQWWFETIETTAFYSRSFRLHLFHSIREPGENFNNIRSDYMDVILRRAMVLLYPRDHPVHWIDANTPFISRGALDKLETALRMHRGYIVKANLQLAPGRKLDQPLRFLPEAERVALVYSLARRILERKQHPTASRGYVEEPGLSLPLWVYMDCGGIGTTNPLLGESRTLIQRIVEKLDPRIPPVWYEVYARIGKTDRRFVLLAQRLLPKRLAGSEAWTVYESFTTMVKKRARRRSRPVTAKDMFEMLKLMDKSQVELTGVGFSAAEWRRLEILITRHCQFA
jgi:hypothetical protein